MNWIYDKGRVYRYNESVGGIEFHYYIKCYKHGEDEEHHTDMKAIYVAATNEVEAIKEANKQLPKGWYAHVVDDGVGKTYFGDPSTKRTFVKIKD